MSDVQTLLARCQELGAEFFPTPEGKLKVRAPAPLPEELQGQLRQHKAEVLALLRATPLTLRCRTCNREARPEGGTLSIDGTGYIQYWRCGSCGAKGSTVFRLQ
jgi:hypothetical protein